MRTFEIRVPAAGVSEPVYVGRLLQFRPWGARPVLAAVNCQPNSPAGCCEALNCRACPPEAEASVMAVALPTSEALSGSRLLNAGAANEDMSVTVPATAKDPRL